MGSHSWCGRKGEIDSNYFGSSCVAENFGWKPIKIEILEVVSEDRKLLAEREWIQKYCKEFGIADCAILCSRSPWALQFRKHGRMLNLHANGSESMREASLRRDVRMKVVKKRFESGELKKTLAKMQEAAKSKEVRERAIKTQIETGNLQKRLDKLNSKEAKSKIDYVTSHIKASETKKLRKSGNYGKHNFVDVYKDGVLVVSGRVNGCCTKLGNSNWSVLVNRKIRAGATEVVHHGYLFVLRIKSK